MKVKKILKHMKTDTYIIIYNSSLLIQYSGRIRDIYFGKQFLDNKVKEIWCDECSFCIEYE